MLSIREIPFIVVDVETTGSNPESNRIIDIACVTVINNEIIEEYASLVNPHQWIPAFISNMTGITYDMVVSAPEGDEIFPRVEKILSEKNAVFVAHNARFDFSFVSHAFLHTDMKPLDAPLLCTLKLARRLIPSKSKKNVGALAEHFGIEIIDRHRALGDAIATAEILIKLIEIAEKEHGIKTIEELLKFQNKQIKQIQPPTAVYKRLEDKIKDLPDEPGVYYFLDKKGVILYVGKAKSLKDRVKTYFHNEHMTSRKISNMLKKAYDLVWEVTETELGALLMESREIKRIQPNFNTMDKNYKEYRFIKLQVGDEFPRLEMADMIENDGAEYYGPFKSSYLVQDIIKSIEKQFKLRKCDIIVTSKSHKEACFYHYIDMCNAPCTGNSTYEDYRQELEAVQRFLSGYSDGIIEQLEEKMMRFADKLEFEKAAKLKHNIQELKKVFERQQTVSTSINKNNLILVIPSSEREKTAEIFLVKTGKMIHQETIGRKAPLNNIFQKVDELFFQDSLFDLSFGQADIDELKIISAWIYRQNGKGNYIYLNNKTPKDIYTEIEFAVRSIFKEESSDKYLE
jgi:DNA polymerase-3 subunit epsilon